MRGQVNHTPHGVHGDLDVWTLCVLSVRDVWHVTKRVHARLTAAN